MGSERYTKGGLIVSRALSDRRLESAWRWITQTCDFSLDLSKVMQVQFSSSCYFLFKGHSLEDFSLLLLVNHCVCVSGCGCPTLYCQISAILLWACGMSGSCKHNSFLSFLHVLHTGMQSLSLIASPAFSSLLSFVYFFVYLIFHSHLLLLSFLYSGYFQTTDAVNHTALSNYL